MDRIAVKNAAGTRKRNVFTSGAKMSAAVVDVAETAILLGATGSSVVPDFPSLRAIVEEASHDLADSVTSASSKTEAVDDVLINFG